ncbi:Mannosyl-3-phosphoglycerate synthase [Colletotrichum trifolii]|uniref:Mannosyl-3-phosphoglycerate synthase n=1 Tax=Colletotrichum trifolii TaxID=5466 RepID=A0A4R8QJQ3_COLTR|nr:Mannosyl-3-phosphoglycerate synthase [Colletotrichum trifolii]
MRLSSSPRFEQFGSVRIHQVQRVIELDAGRGRTSSSSSGTVVVGRHDLSAVESRMAVVVLCMNEQSHTVESVLSGIPHDCFVVLVSNTRRAPSDGYEAEVAHLLRHCADTGRRAVAIHQKDAGAARAFREAGAGQLLDPDDDGLVRDGKGEAMFVGLALAAWAGCEYVGFVDADNYVPGAVLEYCKAFAAGLHLAGGGGTGGTRGDAMVRVAWGSKPKARGGRLLFDRKGRCSTVVNEWLNRLLQELSGYGTECIATGNAGEHAMTMSLAKKLRLAGGFAVEPFELIYLLQGLDGPTDKAVGGGGGGGGGGEARLAPVHIRQIETRNPHLHDDKGDDHVSGMRCQALNMLYHSHMTPPSMKTALKEWMVAEKMLEAGEEPPRERVYPAMEDVDLEVLGRVLSEASETMVVSAQPPLLHQGCCCWS